MRHRKARKPQWPHLEEISRDRNSAAPTDLVNVDLAQLLQTLQRANGTPLGVCYAELYRGTI